MLDSSLFMMMRLGRPQFFITLTVNSADPELRSRLFPGRRAEDDPVMVAQFFEARLRKFLKLLEHGLLGEYVFAIVVIEWQKRGLPHAHILLKVRNKRLDADHATMAEIDRWVTVEESTLRTRLARRIFRRTMRHGCTKICRTKAHRCTDRDDCSSQALPCKKRFPHALQRKTHLDARTGRVVLRRRKPRDRIAVEVNERVLVAWGGHANTKVVSTGQVRGCD